MFLLCLTQIILNSYWRVHSSVVVLQHHSPLFAYISVMFPLSIVHLQVAWRFLIEYIIFLLSVKLKSNLIPQTSVHYRYQYKSCLRRLIIYFGGDKKIIFTSENHFLVSQKRIITHQTKTIPVSISVMNRSLSCKYLL